MQMRKKQQQQQRSSRNPLQDLNNGGIGSCSNDNSSNTSSLSSIEAPKGCLRFFLSHSSSSSSTKTPCSNNSNNHRPKKAKPFSSKTPKSAPNIRPTKENSSKRTIFHKPISQKLEKVQRNPPSCLSQWQSGKKTSSRNAPNSKILDHSGSPVNKVKSGSGELKQVLVDGTCDSDAANVTPLSKIASGSSLNFAVDNDMVIIDDDDEKSCIDTKTNSTGSNNKTPPVQVSISPEIQCASSMISSAKTITPACYAAGHVLSGVTDKRKCWPKGILSVGEAKALGSFDSDDDTEKENNLDHVSNSSASMLPFPTEASMHWLLSPCNEEDEDQKENPENGSNRFQTLEESAVPNSPASPSSVKNGFLLGLCKNSTNRSTFTSSTRGRKSALLSPGELFNFQGFLGSPLHDDLDISASEQKRKNCYNLDGENSPFSIDTLGSGNVIQTPQSNSSSERQVGMSWSSADGNNEKQHNFDPELNLVTEYLQMASLSPMSHGSIWDPIGSSFQFDCVTTPSNSVDLSRFQRILGDQASWFSNSMVEDVSQSQMRISWREGLVSRIFEMDEFDFCRCLSDEEDDGNGCSNECLRLHLSPKPNVDVANNQHSTDGFGSNEFVDREHRIDETAKKGLPPQEQFSRAESTSADGRGLVRSEDSDWTICYKNQLFQV